MKLQRGFFSVVLLCFPAVVFYHSVRFLGSKATVDEKEEAITHQSSSSHTQGEITPTLRTLLTPETIKASTNYVEVDIDHQIYQINQLLQPVVNKKFNCTKLFKGDPTETKHVKVYHKKFPYKHIPWKSFINATNSCSAYISARGYITTISKEEAEFPLAYSLTIHKYVDQFERLLRVIYRPNNYYCIHVDRKAGKKFVSALKGIIKCFPNVFIASKLEIVVYAGFTRLQADINCMRDLYENYTDWKYVLNFAGTELPLKSNKELVTLLKLYNGLNIIGKNNKTLPSRWKKRYSTNIWNHNMTGNIRVVNKYNTKPPFKLKMVKGSAYAIFSRAMIGYVLHDPVPIKFLEWCSRTFSPDEHYWATLNDLEANPQLKTPGGNSFPGLVFITRAVLWATSKCRGKNVRNVCQYGVGNLPWLKERHEFVANKFDLDTDATAVECMEELLASRSHSDVPWDLDIHQHFVETHSKHNATR